MFSLILQSLNYLRTKISLFVKNIYDDYKSLPGFYKLMLLSFILFGVLVRFYNLWHPGFVFDTVETQYTWAKNSFEMGVLNFWANYDGYLDYLPGSILLLTFLQFIGSFFGGSEEVFVALLKLMNWISEVGLFFVIWSLAKKAGNSPKFSLLLATLSYILPSLWFVSGVWGQMDSLVVLLGFSVFWFFYNDNSLKTDKPWGLKDFIFNKSLLSGIILGVSFWIKLQTILLAPILILLFFKKENRVKLIIQQIGFWLINFLGIIVYSLTNINKTVEVFSTIFSREDNISNGASTFWSLVGAQGKGSDFLIKFSDNFGLSVSLAGMLLYIFTMTLVVSKIYEIDYSILTKSLFQKEDFKTKVKTFHQNLIKFLNPFFNKTLSFIEISTIMFFSSSAYFLFFTKMHSRYLHFALIFLLISFALIKFKKTKDQIFLFFAILVMNLGYFLNQVDIYQFWSKNERSFNPNPNWVFTLNDSLNINYTVFSALLIFVSWLFILYIFMNTKNENSKV